MVKTDFARNDDKDTFFHTLIASLANRQFEWEGTRVECNISMIKIFF